MLALVIFAAAAGSLVFTTLSYSLRSCSRARLRDALAARGRSSWLEITMQRRAELVLVTAVCRLLANILVVIGCLGILDDKPLPPAWRYALALALAGAISLFTAVVVPTVLATHFAESIVASSVQLLHVLRLGFVPLVKLMYAVDAAVRRIAGPSAAQPEHIEKEILSVVEEGEREGLVDVQERRMIESVIQFRDTVAGQIMTSRPEIVALELGATLEEIKRTIERTGHSRIPVYDGTLDHIVGVLYARDLLKHLGESAEQFDIRTAMRPAMFVPETRPLRELLRDFRDQKVHMAIVLDEYGGTAGLVTIEDVLEELVGEISDEHEPQEPAMVRRVGPLVFDVDARMYVDDANRLMKLGIPEDGDYDTIGGFVINVLGRIPPAGTAMEYRSVRYVVTEAEPQRVKRVRIELPQRPPAGAAGR